MRQTVVALVLVVWGAPALGPLGPSASTAQESAGPHVVHFSPEGTIKKIRQVTARFSEPMVPLGDPRPASDVFEIACPEAGTARWVDSRDWAYDFARDLPAGVRCTFRLRAGLVTLGGKPVGGQHEFSFSTGGPAIIASLPYAGAGGIDETQAFLLVLDADAVERTVIDHVRFSVEGVVDPVGVGIVSGAVRDEILKTQGRWLPPGPRLVIQARQHFPSGAGVRLVWGSGVATASGVATTEDQVLSFRARDTFKIAFECEREHRDAACIPVTPMQLRFSAPVLWEQARRVALVGPRGRRWKPEARDEGAALHYAVAFKGPFPESSAFSLEVPADLKDDAGRVAINADRFPLTVKTAPFPPLAKFSARFGIVERADPVLPVTLRRLEPEVRARMLRAERDERGVLGELLQRVTTTVLRIPPAYSRDIVPWLRRVAGARRAASVFGPNERARREFTLPKPGGADAFEVVGIPLGEPGLYIVELESARLGASFLGPATPMYVPAAALVTNLSVHFKWGAENGLVWVTTLDHARPVEGARVTVQDCRGDVRWQGWTDARGLAIVTGLPARTALPDCDHSYGDDWTQSRALSQLGSGLFVIAQTLDDLSFVHSSWDDGVEPWRFQLPRPSSWQGAAAVHTIFDRPLLRAGDTVHMKHVVRTRTLTGFAPTPPKDRPTKAIIRHTGSDEKYELPLAWDAVGAAESTWAIPKSAKLGRYVVAFDAGSRGAPPRFEREGEREGGEFRVEEFRIPFMKAVLRPPAEPQVNATEIPLDLSVRYLAGGGARRLPVTLRAQILPKTPPPFDGFDRFAFANGVVAEGTTRRGLADTDEGGEGAEAPAGQIRRAKPVIHQRDQLTLDAAGTARATIRGLPPAATPRDLLTELEFRDPAGEVQTVSTRIPLWPASRLVGIRPESSVAFGDHISTQVAVVDLAGRPVAGAEVRVDVFERTLYSHRKRLVGGFYAYEHVQQIRRRGEFCRGVTPVGGVLVCEGAPGVSGHIILQALTTDSAGHTTTAQADVWMVGPEAQWWFDVSDSDRIDLLPERRRYEPNETARLQVRMPFREATALVTVEREGVLDAWVRPVSGSEPGVEVPLRGVYAPNVFVSVLVVRGRVGGIQPTAMVDLGRPAFKLGIAEIRVGWRAHELTVKVTSGRTTYRVRDTVPVSIAVRTSDGKAPAPGSEIAVAAVDEGLLELLPNESWNLLEGMMQRRDYAVETSTAQGHVVGQRHFGLKALPQGGGGGSKTTRELFDTLLFWKARVALDARGDAALEIPLNDSLTSFRIVAVATSGVDAFGTGALTVRTTQDLMVLPGIAPLVREGDRFPAEVTLRNATERPMEVVAAARVEGLATPLGRQTVALAAGEAHTVAWEVTAPVGARTLRYEIEAGEAGGRMDRVVVAQQVVAAVSVRTFQATLFQWDPRQRIMRQAVERPADAVPGRGGVQIALRPTLVEGLDALRGWMRAYPYTCLEQLVSRAVALRDEAQWRIVLNALPAHLDADGLLKYFPSMVSGSEVLTAYVLALSNEAGWPIPEDVRGRLEGGLRAFIEGRIVRRSEVPSPDLTLRKLAALEALARYGRAEPALLASLRVEPNLWPTSAVLDWWSILRRVDGIADRAARLAEAERVLRARLNLQGTTMGFSTERSDALWWLMVSSDSNAVRLILALLDADKWRDDLPRLVGGALARQQRGAWDLTTANAWGVLALEKFSRSFERTPVGGRTSATLAAVSQRIDWLAVPKGGTLALPWPTERSEVALSHEGSGQPWITVQAQAAIPLAAPLSSGYKIAKTITPIEQQHPGRWSRGDLLRVKLEVEAQADMSWVVVNDPIPGGASHVGRGLRRESSIATKGQSESGAAWPAYEERAFEAFRAYYAWVPKGTFTVEYTLRLNQTGRFLLPTTRVDALYAPEMFGELPNAPVEVRP